MNLRQWAQCFSLRFMWLLATQILIVSTVHAERVLDRIVAVVDDGVVLQSELERRINSVRARLEAQNTTLPPPDVFRARILDQLILEEIQLQMAANMGIRVSDNELNETVRNIAARNGLTVEAFAEELKKEGVTLAEAVDQIRRELIIGRLQQRVVTGRVRVTEAEVKNFLDSAAGKSSSSEEYLIGHILVALPPGATEAQRKEKRQEVQDILREIRAGADFRQMAVARSDGRNALEGGVIGWRKRNELPSIAEEIIPTLAVGEVSDPIETGSGFHLVSVLDKKGGQADVVTQYKVRHILVKPSALRTEEEARKKAEAIYAQLKAGAAFDVLAKKESEDAISGSQGGDLGWVSPGDMVPQFEKVMVQAPVGVVSKPFRTNFGWHVLLVEETRQQDIGEKLKARRAQEILQRKKYEAELQKWLREIREEAYVDIKDREDSAEDV